MLGWFVLVGEAVATFVEAQARNWLTNTMMVEWDTAFSVNDWDVSAHGPVPRRGADLDGTV
jgi:hypothetical protein